MHPAPQGKEQGSDVGFSPPQWQDAAGKEHVGALVSNIVTRGDRLLVAMKECLTEAT